MSYIRIQKTMGAALRSSRRGRRPSAFSVEAWIVLCLVISGAAACKRGAPEAAAAGAENTMTVGTENIVIVQTGTLSAGPSVSGTLVPEREARVTAQIGGSVLQIFADQGQRVSAGSSLARIEATGIQDTYLSARAAVTAARNNADVANRELARARRLLAGGAIAERDIEQAQRNAIAASAQLSDARARLAMAQRQVSNANIRSPISGIVSERAVSSGDVVQPGSPLFTVVDPSSMRLEASVPADQLAAVRVGSTVTFNVSGYPGREFVGRVTRVNPTADPATRQVRIYVTIPNAGSALVGGLFANGRLSAESRSGLVAPLAAIDSRTNVPAVLRIRAGRVERVQVQLGLRDERSETIEIVAGVQAGDTLLLGAAQGITPGTVVRVTSPTDVLPANAAPAAPANKASGTTAAPAAASR